MLNQAVRLYQLAGGIDSDYLDRRIRVAIERRKALLGLSGDDYVLPNSGEYRAPEKRELLWAIAEESVRQGKRPALPGKY
jgi:hypothetical protein